MGAIDFEIDELIDIYVQGVEEDFLDVHVFFQSGERRSTETQVSVNRYSAKDISVSMICPKSDFLMLRPTRTTIA